MPTPSRYSNSGSPSYGRPPLPPSPLSKQGSNQALDEDTVFQVPPDLICPISQTIFLDPCLTTAGQAYERNAIEQHLCSSDTDPLTNSRLSSKALTPVYVLKSRALEYRESTARACIDRACSPAPRADPAALLRRAVELSTDAGFLPHGLTPQVAAYVSSHPSNAYDRLALEMFAKGLQENGYRDKAAAVYFYLLSSEDDVSAQAGMLRRCLACWQGSDLRDGVDAHVFDKLVGMLGRRTSIAWVVEVAGEAHLGLDFVAQLCEHLLFPPVPPPSAAASEPPESLPWECEKEILVKYTRVLTTSLRGRVEGVESRLDGVEKRGRRGLRNIGNGEAGSSSSSGNLREIDNYGRNISVLRRLRATLRHPFVILPCTIIAAVGDPKSAPVRVIHLLPLLSLIRNGSE